MDTRTMGHFISDSVRTLDIPRSMLSRVYWKKRQLTFKDRNYFLAKRPANFSQIKYTITSRNIEIISI